MSINNCRLIDLEMVCDTRGLLTIIEAPRHIPFAVARVFFISDVPKGSSRGGHAHKTLQQFLIPVVGSFEVLVDDGMNTRAFMLSKGSQGLYIPPLIWDTEQNFAPGTICLVLASDVYDERDYYRKYESFLQAVETTGQTARG